MLTNTAPDDTLAPRHQLGTAGSPTPADGRSRSSLLAHHADEAPALAVAAGTLAEVHGDGASS